MREKVLKGIALLNEKIPNWYDDIDLESLDMGLTGNCISGQIAGSIYNLDNEEDLSTYFDRLGLYVTDWSNSILAEYGFSCYSEEYWDKLTEIWKEEISKLQNLIISQKTKKVSLDSLEEFDYFLYNGRLFIVGEDEYVCIENGYTKELSGDTQVTKVKVKIEYEIEV